MIRYDRISLIFFGLVVIIVLIVLIAKEIPNTINRIQHPECYRVGGQWTMFSSGCVDACGAKACTAAFTAGCDCGLDKCWSGTNCIPNPTYKK